jgi:hypothetical protein
MSSADRYAILLNDTGPVRLCWRTTPHATGSTGGILSNDFAAASAAIEKAATLSGQQDFHEPWLTDPDGNRLTFGSELPALIADFLTKGQDAIATGKPSEWLRALLQAPLATDAARG